MKKRIREADAILIVTPEYNYSIPGFLNNAIDWASRRYGESAWNDPVMASLIGMLTGVGGGMMRDVLVAEIPQVLRSDLYAVAALAGAVVVVIGHQLHVAPAVAAVLGAVICFNLRLSAIRRGWQLPVAHVSPREE